MPPAPTTICEVIERMETILDPLGRNDGVACFTRLYLEVTKGVQARLQGLVFAVWVPKTRCTSEKSAICRQDANFGTPQGVALLGLPTTVPGRRAAWGCCATRWNASTGEELTSALRCEKLAGGTR